VTARHDDGQTTVELALGLPFVVALLLALVQCGLLVRDRVLVTHAAREGARAAALDDDSEAVEQAAADAGPLDPERLRVTVDGRGGPGTRVTVQVAYRAPTALPLIGHLLGDVELTATATMRVER
jgi:Flp pilus assembly protein TadG